jgi:hypothetical protein
MIFRPQLDHVFPASRAGQPEIKNLVTYCWPCNYGKKHYTVSVMDDRNWDVVVVADVTWRVSRGVRRQPDAVCQGAKCGRVMNAMRLWAWSTEIDKYLVSLSAEAPRRTPAVRTILRTSRAETVDEGGQ